MHRQFAETVIVCLRIYTEAEVKKQITCMMTVVLLTEPINQSELSVCFTVN